MYSNIKNIKYLGTSVRCQMGLLKPARYCWEKIRKLSIKKKKRDTSFSTKYQQSLVEIDKWLLELLHYPVSRNANTCRPKDLYVAAVFTVAETGHNPKAHRQPSDACYTSEAARQWKETHTSPTTSRTNLKSFTLSEKSQTPMLHVTSFCLRDLLEKVKL